ncbi:ABC transporter permease [Nisaea acidiphila]|uniref:ABC transporter permease n=1 Tax=Nisaea acidiphila TaxID=1862145 RepID=A0A9J7ATG9_9PROT|nr:ABC transporter permease [Nisaea acidiphila]UUX49777.1 ABC transporter permease [Nisaea acidiphila]
MTLLRIAGRSLANRRTTATLTVLALAISIALFLSVERTRTSARVSFANTIAGTDLIVGARSGSVQLMLYSVFRIGNATNNITWESYRDIAARPEVAWTVPLSLGDSHRGFRVLGTTEAYFEHYRFRGGRKLEMLAGAPFSDLFDTTLGADVAKELGYKVGDPIVVAHGLGAIGFSKHEDMPFRVSGILKKTGTPVDRTVHVSLAAIEAIHVDWQSGARVPGQSTSAEAVRKMDLTPKAITAVLVGVTSKLKTFKLQRFINEYREEPLLAVLPGVALQELWSLIGVAETALAAISAMVVLTALVGMIAAILSSLAERRREMAILRAVGAGPGTIAYLMILEAALLSLAGAAAGSLLFMAGLAIAGPLADTAFGLYLPLSLPNAREIAILGLIVLAGILSGLFPAFRAYRMSLADGMTIRQ